MFPAQHALEGMPSGSQAMALARAEPGQGRDQKPKVLPCKYCNKRFRRVEHVQRHERTHTKEKPFSCDWDRCGKTFGRRDLLVRHEKLVHLNEGSKDGSRPRKSSAASSHKPTLSDDLGRPNAGHQDLGPPHAPPPPPPLEPQQQHAQRLQGHHHQYHQPQAHHYHHGPASPGAASLHMHQDHRCTPRSAACNLDVLSDAAALATEGNPMQSMVGEAMGHGPAHVQDKVFAEGFGERPRGPDQQHFFSSGFAPQPRYDDYSLFLDDMAASPHLVASHFEPDQQLAAWARSPARYLSHFPSRLASVALDSREGADSVQRPHDDLLRTPPFRISAIDHVSIKSRIEEYSAVLPGDFVFPSRHTLTRFLEGYLTDFHEQVPFLHLPTLVPSELAPELLLAMLAVGAQHRFESDRGYALWYAAKAVATEQIRRRRSSEVHALLPTAAAYSPHSTRPSPSTSYRHSFASAQSERPKTQDTHREPYSPNTPQARLETIQAALILFAAGLWGAKTILDEALSLQSTLSMLIRQEGLRFEASQAMLTDWDSWVRWEGANRTKLVAYCFFNLCSIAYDMPPLLMTSEVNMALPLRARLWRAESSWQWQELRQTTPVTEITVHEAVSQLFSRNNPGLPAHISSLGYYVLIHTLIQHVYLLKQTSLSAGVPFNTRRMLRPEDADEVTQALAVWQAGFEHRRQSRAAESGNVASPGSSSDGSLTSNATALLRLVYIRLYADMESRRPLETRDATLIASALGAMPPLLRSQRLHRAVFQAVQALSMLVKVGVNYVARAKSTEWSIQLSLCNFEGATLLAKWLLALAAMTRSDPAASPEDKGVLDMILRLVDETEFAVPVDPSLSGPGTGAGQMDTATSDGIKLRQLASAVLRLWAKTFKGTHIFDLVQVMGASLDGYADLVDRPPDRGAGGKLAAEAG